MHSCAYLSSVRSIAALLCVLTLIGGEGMAGARRASVDNRESALAAVERQEQALVALGRLLPAASVRGVYTRNQFSAEFPYTVGSVTTTLVIQPLDQVDGYFQLDVPIVDIAAWARLRSAREGARAARHSARATTLEVEKQVARNYYQLIGAAALRRSAEHTLAAARANHDLTRERRAGGIATQLDVERARAEVERARQSIADAELLSQLSGRALLTLSGVAASGEISETQDDLHEEAALDTWERGPEQAIPALAAAAADRQAALAGARAAKLALLPTLTATAFDRVTNASGFFLGHNSFYSLTLTLAWRLDVSMIGTLRAQNATAAMAGVREERARLAAKDQIHEAWQRVRAGIAKSQAARSQTQAAVLAARSATERYTSGAGTQLDVVQAQRDAFAAEVARIQADADLAFARAFLRLAAGQPLDKEGQR